MRIIKIIINFALVINKRAVKFIFLLVLLLSLKVEIAFCQGPPPAANCPDPPCGAIPIDGGISVLIIAGAAYGAKKMFNLNKVER